MKPEHQFVQETLEDMLDSVTNHTVQALDSLTKKDLPAPIRAMLLKRLSESWQSSPVRMHVPKALIELGRYADNDAMFTIQCGKLTSFLLTIKNGIDYGNSYN